MREFSEIERNLGLEKQGFTVHGTLFVMPARVAAERVVVRRFDGDWPAALIPAYSTLLRASSVWLEHDGELAKVVRVEQPTEVGRDFIARRQLLGTRLSAYLKDDDRPEAPSELGTMQARFIAKVAAAGEEPRANLVADVLRRSILEPTGYTIYSEREDKFIILDLNVTSEELERWATLTNS